MKSNVSLASVSFLALALVACGSPEEKADAPGAAEDLATTQTSSASNAAAPAGARPPIFAVCGACHAVDPGKDGIGPSLAGVFNAKAGHAATHTYSDAMKNSGLTWNEATLDRYLKDPRSVVPGTTMAYGGLRNDDQRKAVIDYLKTL